MLLATVIVLLTSLNSLAHVNSSDTEELIARIKARANLEDNELIFNDYLKVSLTMSKENIKRNEQWQEIQLTLSKYKILKALIQAA